jgi:cytochrome bd-type quinol oxidase subunit 2
MTKKDLKRLIGVVVTAVAAAPYVALAQFGGSLKKLDSVAGQEGAGYDTSNSSDSLLTQIGTYIKYAIDLTGVIFLCLAIYAGFTWMTAQGDQKKVTEAKETLTRAVIGLIIIVLAYAITAFVFNRLGAAQQTSTN